MPSIAEQDWKYYGYRNVAFSGKRDEIEETAKQIAAEFRGDALASSITQRGDQERNGQASGSFTRSVPSLTSGAHAGETLPSAKIAPFSRRLYNPYQAINGTTYCATIEFEGYITEVRPKTFVAMIVETNAPSNVPGEEAEFQTSDVDERDADKLVLGAIFRWQLGLERLPHGQRRRTSTFYFRPNLSVSEDSYEKARIEAEEMLKQFGVL